jgi:hypothetical protein
MKAIGCVITAALLTSAFAAVAIDAGGDTPESTVAVATSERIPQPSLDGLEEVTRSRVAPEDRRVDLFVPTFTHPTLVTNRLFPISDLHSAVLIGKYEGKPWRAETTLLPDTRMVEWNGQKIEVLQSQFVAYIDGRIYEVAVDLYAQADDGSVWYFGEDAFSYERGRVSEVNETWHAGVEGPATMIMPGEPHVGDVYRPENIPGLIFEQVTVKDIAQTREGPVGKVKGVMVGQELHMEGDFEDKTFAPGYGELRSGLGEDYEANALAIPVDALSQPLPPELPKLSSNAILVLDAIRMQDWGKAEAGIGDSRAAYDAYQKRQPPKELDAQARDALDGLANAVQTRDPHAAPIAALNVALAATDMMLRYQRPEEIDAMRFDLWCRQLIVDAEIGEKGFTAGDVATLGWLRDRMALDHDSAQRVDDQLRFLVAATDAKDMTSTATAAERLRKTLLALAPK